MSAQSFCVVNADGTIVAVGMCEEEDCALQKIDPGHTLHPITHAAAHTIDAYHERQYRDPADGLIKRKQELTLTPSSATLLANGIDEVTVTISQPARDVYVCVNHEVLPQPVSDSFNIISRMAQVYRIWVLDPRYYSEEIRIVARKEV